MKVNVLIQMTFLDCLGFFIEHWYLIPMHLWVFVFLCLPYHLIIYYTV